MLDLRYLLTTTIPVLEEEDGSMFVDHLWYVDLRRHLEYLDRLTIACPIRRVSKAPPSATRICADDPLFGRLQVARLRMPESRVRSLLALPLLVFDAFHLLGKCDVLHSHVVGWPVPTAFFTVPIALIRGVPVVILIESWPSTSAGGLRGWVERLLQGISCRIAKWCVSKADVAIYTHQGYMASFPPGGAGRGYVLPASWIDEAWLMSKEEAGLKWQWATAEGAMRPVRVVYAGRLVREKGVATLIDAVVALRAYRSNIGGDVRCPAVSIDFYGDGECLDLVRSVEGECYGVSVRHMGTLAYGRPFLDAMKTYDLGVVPGLGTEQPRILYDYLSQAVPVLAFDTPGNREVVSSDHNGVLLNERTAESLARAILSLALVPTRLRELGLNAVATASKFTHLEMHRERERILSRHLSGSLR